MYFDHYALCEQMRVLMLTETARREQQIQQLYSENCRLRQQLDEHGYSSHGHNSQISVSEEETQDFTTIPSTFQNDIDLNASSQVSNDPNLMSGIPDFSDCYVPQPILPQQTATNVVDVLNNIPNAWTFNAPNIFEEMDPRDE